MSLNKLARVLYNGQGYLLFFCRESWTLIELLQINNWIYLNMIMLPYIIPLDNPLFNCNAINEISGSLCFVCLLFPWLKEEILIRRKFYLNKCGNWFKETGYSCWWHYEYAHLGCFAFLYFLFIRLYYLYINIYITYVHILM